MSEDITITDVSVSVREQVLVGPVSMQARAGELTCLVGPNGSGKTTLLRAVAGLVEHAGKIMLGSDDMRTLSGSARARRMAYVPQRSLLDAPLQVHSVVAQGRYSFGERVANTAEVTRALTRVGMQALAERVFTRLSLGEQRRVLIARALASSARVLLLDEPDAYLDVRERLRLFELLDTLRAEGHTLLVVVHALDAALRHADRCALLQRGKLVACDTPALALSAENLRNVFGVDLLPDAGPRFALSVSESSKS